jgi:hypothetical protein
MDSILIDGFKATQMVYGDGSASARILELIKLFVENLPSRMSADAY